jgi:ParB family chromosome partitioning protein
MVKRGLGKGLSALIPTKEKVEGLVKEISINKIKPNPFQPREDFNLQRLDDLATSIKSFGLIQPIIVRPKGENYEMVAGERRFKGAKIAELETIPCVIMDINDEEVVKISLIENLQREDLNAVERANAYKRLVDEFNITHEDLSKTIGVSRTSITNTLRLLTLPKEIKDMIMNEQITPGHAIAILAIKDDEEKINIVRKVVKRNLNVRQTENLVKKFNMVKSGIEIPEKFQVLQPTKLPKIIKELSDHLKTKVNIKFGKRKGKIVIDFKSIAELKIIYYLITGIDLDYSE